MAGRLTHCVVEALAERLLLAEVPTGREDGESGSDYTLEPTEEYSDGCELSVGVACAEAHDHSSPDDTADCKAASEWEVLQNIGHRVLRYGVCHVWRQGCRLNACDVQKKLVKLANWLPTRLVSSFRPNTTPDDRLVLSLYCRP